MWSLVTETRKGLDNRTEATPMTIDAQYSVGFDWARQYGLRVTKNFDNKLWIGASIEGPQTLFGGKIQTQNTLIAAPGDLGGLFNNQANYSYNKTPDFIVKGAWEPGWGHYEVFGILSNFRTRIFPCVGATTAVPCPINGAIQFSNSGLALRTTALRAAVSAATPGSPSSTRKSKLVYTQFTATESAAMDPALSQT